MGPRRPVRPTGSACLSLAAKSRFLGNRDAVGGYSVRMGYDEVLFSDATDRIDRLLSETFGIALSLHRSGDDAFRNDLANSRGLILVIE